MNISDITESIARQIEDASKSGTVIVGLFDHLPAAFKKIDCNPFPCLSTKSLVINLPFDRILMKRVNAAFLDAGWTLAYEVSEREVSNSDTEKPTVSYRYPNTSGDVTIFWNSRLDGSTCQRRLVGTFTTDVPVYEFSCEAAK